jgi:VWFA-related protein
MNALRLLIASFVVGACAWWSGWYEPFHLDIGGTALVLLILAAIVWRRARREEGGVAVAEGTGEGPFRAAFFGLAAGLGLCVLLAAIFAGVGRIDPLVSLFRDGGRKPFEARLEQLTKAGNHTEAIRLLKQRLDSGRLSRPWRGDLVAQLYQELLHAAEEEKYLAGRVALLEQAFALAKAGVDTRLAAELLAQEKARAATRAKLEQLNSGRQWPELIANLQFVMKGRPKEEWEIPCDQWLYTAYLQWAKDSVDIAAKKERLLAAGKIAEDYGLDPSTSDDMLQVLAQRQSLDAQMQKAAAQARAEAQDEIEGLQERHKRELEEADRKHQHAERLAHFEALLHAADTVAGANREHSLSQRLQLLEQARDYARRHGLDVTNAEALLSKTRAELAEYLERLARDSRPADLPSGAKARFLHIGTDRFPPTIDVELAVEDRAGHPVPGLGARDFQITCDGQSLPGFYLASVARKPVPFNVVVALDCSGSMAGSALRAALSGAQDLLCALAAGQQVKLEVLAFSDRVQPRCSWTTDWKQAAAAVAGIKAGGQTALFATIRYGLNDLAGRAGDKYLILFTDGRDTVAGAGFNLAALTTELRAAGVAVYVIGLQTQDLDRDTLQHLAEKTGGVYLQAGRPGDLAAQFLEAHRQLGRAFYRLVLSPAARAGTASLDLRITVGGSNAVTASTVVQLPGEHLAATR